ncbi:MAG: hypothetical protein ABIQ32_01795 [Sphingomicrobium sp.]
MENKRSEPGLFPFTPTHVSRRHDGWTAARQIAFVEALAETACVDEACRRVGMSDTSAYAFRLSDRGSAFRDAWEAAVEYVEHRVDEGALARSLKGVARPVFHKGEQVGEWRHFDERLTMFLLARRERRLAAKMQQPTFAPLRRQLDSAEDPAERLAIALEGIDDEFDLGGEEDRENP